MPEPLDLRLHRADGQCVITTGSVVLFAYGESDVVMRNLAISALRRLGFTGRRVAAVMGLTENYVATLHAGAVRDGSAALVRRPAPGRPGKLADQDWADAAAWRAQGLTDTEIGQRLGVAHTTVARHLGSRRKAEGERPGPAAQVQDELPVPVRDELPVPVRDEPGPVIGTGSFASRYAGAMLLHAFGSQAGAGQVLAAAGLPAGSVPRPPADVALLSAASACFALGAATIEQFKHLTAGEAGPLAGLVSLPGQRAIRPRLAAMAEAAEPAGLQAAFAAAMLAASPPLSGACYVDDHFVPYTGAKPVGKGWNNKRGRAEKGRADTHVTAHDGRAVCFVTGDGRFVEDRIEGLEDVRHPGGDVEGDLDVGGGGLPREADGVVEENLVSSGLDDRGRQAGQVGEYGADEAESGVLSRRIVGDSGLEVFSAHQRVDLALGFHGRPGQGEVGIRRHDVGRGWQGQPVISGVDQGGDGEPTASGLSREDDVRRGSAVLKEGCVGCKSVVDRCRIRMLGGEPVVDGDDPGARPPANLRGQVSGLEGVP